MNDVKIPSNKQIGEAVVLDINGQIIDYSCEIAAIKFTDFGKVLYDIRLVIGSENDSVPIIIRDVDSYIVKEKPNQKAA